MTSSVQAACGIALPCRQWRAMARAMSTDIASLETELTAAVEAAADEAALEAVRVAALGLFPRDDFAGVFNQAFARAQGHVGKHAPPMHARTAHLQATAGRGGNSRRTGGGRGHAKNLVR